MIFIIIHNQKLPTLKIMPSQLILSKEEIKNFCHKTVRFFTSRTVLTIEYKKKNYLTTHNKNHIFFVTRQL